MGFRRGSHRVRVRRVATGGVAIWDRGGPHRVDVRRGWTVGAEVREVDEAGGWDTVDLECIAELLATGGREAAGGVADATGCLEVLP